MESFVYFGKKMPFWIENTNFVRKNHMSMTNEEFIATLLKNLQMNIRKNLTY